MRLRFEIRYLVPRAIAAICAVCSAASIAQDVAIVPSPAFSAEQLNALPEQGWLTNGGNLFNQRYSPLDAINRDNVAELKAVWRASLDGSGIGPRSASSFNSNILPPCQ